jgi:hypothetical protein
MEGDGVEIALHHHRKIGPADGIGGAIQGEEVVPLGKHLGFRGVQVFRLGPVQGAPAEADHPPLPVADGHHHPMAKAVVKPPTPFAGHHQTGRLQHLGAEALHCGEVGEQTVPTFGGVAQLEIGEGGFAEAPCVLQIAQGFSPLWAAELGLVPARRQAEHTVQEVAAGELLTQPFLLGAFEGLHRQLVAACQIEHDIAEGGALELHQKLDGISPGPTRKAVVDLLGRRHRHRWGGVVVEGADANEFPTLLLQHHVLAHHIHDVGAFLDRFDRARVQAGESQAQDC